MKKIFKKGKWTLVIILLLVIANFKGYSQAISDSTAVIQKCIDLPSVQTYFSKNTDGSYKQVNVMNFPVSFDKVINISKFGQPVLFSPRSEMNNINPDVFLFFKTFQITGTTASVDFEISYNRLSSTSGFVMVSASLTKTNGIWSISSSTLK